MAILDDDFEVRVTRGDPERVADGSIADRLFRSWVTVIPETPVYLGHYWPRVPYQLGAPARWCSSNRKRGRTSASRTRAG